MAEYSSYKTQYVSGSVAYDYSNTAAYPERHVGRQVEIPTARKVRDEVVQDVHVGNEQAVSPAAVIGLLVAAVLLVFSLFARAQLSQTSIQVVRLQNQLTELETTHQKLLINYEYAFNLAEIEDYAMTQLGMQQPTSDQVYYINSGTVDKAEVLTPETGASGFEKIISAVKSYLD